MRILYLHQFFTTPAMPGITRSYELARRLVRAGHDVDVVTSRPEGGRRGWDVTEEDGIRVHWCPVPYANQMPFRARMRAFATFAARAGPRAAALGGDVLYASSPPLTTALPAAYAARRRRIPVVFEVRDLWPELPIAIGALKNPVSVAAGRRLERFAYRQSRRVVALSPGMKAGVVATGYPADRVDVIPNACDFDLFDAGPEPGRAFRREHAWLGDRPLVAYVGKLGYMNGVDYLARVAAATLPLDPEVRRAAADLGVLDRTFFMLPSVAKRDVPALLAAADITTGLFIDVEEMWSNSANKFFDSLAAAKPIAINYGGWHADLLAETGAGLRLDVHDPAAAADRLVAAVRDPAWLADAGAAARQLGLDRFDRDRLALQLERVLHDAARGADHPLPRATWRRGSSVD